MDRLTEREEDILESLWIEINENRKKPDTLVLKDDPAFQLLLDKCFLDLKKDSLFTRKGLKEAEQCVRRHRLAERLLADVLDVKDPFIHEAGCKFEHGLHHGLEDSICTLLGHPKRCPHGKRIPPGECCKREEKIPQRLIVPLEELSPQAIGKVSYIGTQDQEALKKLLSMGILPGNRIKLLHRFPSFVFEMDKSTFAIDKELAKHIYILLLNNNS